MLFKDVFTENISSKQLSTLLRISNALASTLELSVVLQMAIDSTVDVLELDTGAIYLLEGDELFLGATAPPLEPELSWLKSQPELLQNHQFLQQAFALKKPVYVPDLREVRLSPKEAAIRAVRNLVSGVYIPLLSEDQPIGILIVSTTDFARELTENELALCRVLSSQVALAVVNARLYKTVRQAKEDLFNAYDATLLGWSIAIELRDRETQGHTMRVTELTDKIARFISLPAAEQVNIHRGALLHDIGKIGVPDDILKKTGPLTDDEWVIMKQHCAYAYEFLLHVDYLLPALDIPYCHHERWDGKGYPRGLKGEEIPLSARIFSVVDVYDALTSNRPYRKAWRKEDAVEYIRDQAGMAFDPCIVAIFLQEIR